MIKSAISLIISISLWSCDFIDDRLKIRNDSERTIYYTYQDEDTLIKDKNAIQVYDIYRYANEGGDEKIDTVYNNRVLPDSIHTVPFNANWETSINSYPDKSITFFIFSKDTLLKYNWNDIVEMKAYEKKESYSVEELKSRNWVITYP